MIEVKHLTKQYGVHTAVSDLSFTITPGQIYGFLGPNGAGKSTTMNIITGCLAATSGDVKIGGYDIFEQPKEAKSLVGYLPEMPPLYMDQTVREYLYFVARAKGLKKKEIPAEVEKVIAETHIESMAHKLIQHLSKGYKQRVGIAQALLGNPEIIILDEPTVGLDPAQIIEIRDLIKKLGETHTVILSSHILSEVQAICDEVLIIHKGKLVAFDKLDQLSKTLSSGNTIELCCEISADDMKDLIADIDGIVAIDVKEDTEAGCMAVLCVGEVNPKDICREIFMAFAQAGQVLQQLNPVKATLEDIFMAITREDSDAVESVVDATPVMPEMAEEVASEEAVNEEVSVEAESDEEVSEETADEDKEVEAE